MVVSLFANEPSHNPFFAEEPTPPPPRLFFPMCTWRRERDRVRRNTARRGRSGKYGGAYKYIFSIFDEEEKIEK
jgi:hypothetical protein